MPIGTISADLPLTNKSVLLDYTSEMNAILNTLDKRVFNLEIALKSNSHISDHLNTDKDGVLSRTMNTIIIQEQSTRELVRNSIDSVSQPSVRNQRPMNLIIDKQLHQSNLSFQVSFNETDPSIISLHSGVSKHITPKLPPLNQMKTRGYEFAAIFEDAFDQLIVIYKALSNIDFNKNNNQIYFDEINLKSPHTRPSISSNFEEIETDCDPFALNLAGIFIMNDHDKLRYEIEYFFHILMLFFHAILLESEIDFISSIDNTHNHLPSIQLIELNNRLEKSQENISKLSFIKKHFQNEKVQQLNILNSTKSQLTDHLMEEKYRSKIALRYCNDWKRNHILQWIEMLLQIEQTYKKTINQYENILKQTEITHQETIEILLKQNNEIKSNVNKWYDYYRNETYRFERELISFRQEFYSIKRQRENMYEEYQRMKIIVDEDHQMKINEQLFLEKQKQKEDAIKRIQAWWRGTMSRHMKQKRRKKKKK